MGGGGGFNPIPIITTMIYGPEAGGLVATAMGSFSGFGQSSDSGGGGQAQAQAEAQAEARAAADQAAQQAEDNLRADRQRRQAEILAQNKSQQRASLASQNALAQTLGAPAVETSQLKEKLGQ